MKKFTNFINESEMKEVTLEWMEEKFKYFNKEYFNNELPPCTIIASSDLKLIGRNTFGKFCLGMWAYNKRRKQNGKIIMYHHTKGEPYNLCEETRVTDITKLNPRIIMNKHIRFTENDMEDTLIHEMIHYYTYKDGLAPIQAHGTEFRHMCDKIRALAKQKNGKQYRLTIYGDMSTHEVDLDIQDLLDALKRKREKRASNTAAILIELDTKSSNYNVLKCPNRFVFCTRGTVSKIVEEIKKIDLTLRKSLKSLTISYTAFTDACQKYGKFATSRSYRYYDLSKYPMVKDFILEDENKEVIYKYILEKEMKQEEVNVVPNGINLSAINSKENEEIIGDNNELVKIPNKDLSNDLI